MYKRSYLRLEKLGETVCLNSFKVELTNNVDFYVPIKKLKLFTSAVVIKSINLEGKDVAIRSDRETFSRLQVIQKSRKIT